MRHDILLMRATRYSGGAAKITPTTGFHGIYMLPMKNGPYTLKMIRVLREEKTEISHVSHSHVDVGSSVAVSRPTMSPRENIETIDRIFDIR